MIIRCSTVTAARAGRRWQAAPSPLAAGHGPRGLASESHLVWFPLGFRVSVLQIWILSVTGGKTEERPWLRFQSLLFKPGCAAAATNRYSVVNTNTRHSGGRHWPPTP